MILGRLLGSFVSFFKGKG